MFRCTLPSGKVMVHPVNSCVRLSEGTLQLADCDVQWTGGTVHWSRRRVQWARRKGRSALARGVVFRLCSERGSGKGITQRRESGRPPPDPGRRGGMPRGGAWPTRIVVRLVVREQYATQEHRQGRRMWWMRPHTMGAVREGERKGSSRFQKERGTSKLSVPPRPAEVAATATGL